MRRLAAALGVTILLGTLGQANPPPPVKKVAEGVLLVDDGGLVLLTPDGREKERLTQIENEGVLSPDGKWLAFLRTRMESRGSAVVLRSRTKKDVEITIPGTVVPSLVWRQLVWASDSRRLLIVHHCAEENPEREADHFLYDLESKRVKRIILPDDCCVAGWSRDGTRFLAITRSDRTSRIAWIKVEGAGKPGFLTPANEDAVCPRLSPNDQHVLYRRGSKRKYPTDQQLYCLDLTTKKSTRIDEGGGLIGGYCWSPCGTEIAYAWQKRPDDLYVPSDREVKLIVSTPDGKNQRAVASRKAVAQTGTPGIFTVLDWK